MEALYELINFLPDQFVPCFANRLNKLFLFLRGENEMSADEAAKKYFGDTKKLKYFNKLKNELKRTLIKYIIANSPTSNKKHKTLFEDTYRKIAIYRLLLMNQFRKAGIEIANSILTNLFKLELHHFAHIVASDLLFHYSSIEVSKRLAKKYEQVVEEQLKLVEAETFIRKYHNRIALLGNTRESFDRATIQEFREAMDHVLPYLELPSYHLKRMVYNILIARYMVEYNYKKVIECCDQALTSFPSDYSNIRSIQFAFMQKKIPALQALNKVIEGKKLAEQITQMVPAGSFNWHLALSRRVSICLHAGHYQEAYDIYKAYDQQECLSKEMAEYWQILRGYIYFLIQIGKIQEYKTERFSLGKFLNEVPVYSRDKAGNNINILIIQILVLIQRNHYGRIIDWVESLSTYARTYTRSPETARANIFINMIIKMEAASFHRTGTERKVQKLKTMLANTPLALGQNLAIEVVPYEILWEFMLELLEDKFRGSNARATRKKKQ